MARVFISFTTEDREVGEAVKRELENRLTLKGDVFMTSDREQLMAGEDWFARIQREIRASHVVLLMLSHRGVRRPWVNFEAGAAWLAGKPLIPVCFGRMRIESLPRPYSNFQALSLPAQKDFLIESVANHLGLPKPPSTFLNDVLRFAEQVKEGRKPSVWEAVADAMSVEGVLRKYQDE